jgi:hypothetical protein
MYNITNYQKTQIKTTMRYHLIPVRMIKKIEDAGHSGEGF